MFRTCGLVLIVAAGLLVSGDAWAAVEYTITDLGTLGVSAGYSVAPTPTSVARVGGNVEVAGQGLISSPPYYYYYDSWYWTKGSGIVDFSPAISTLSGITWGGGSPTASTLGSWATGINASGQIVGTYGYNSYGGVGGGFSYTIGNAAVRMKSPNGAFSLVGGVNSSGQVAVADGASPTSAGIAYADGVTAGTDLGPGANGSLLGYVINDSGWVGGWGEMSNLSQDFGVYANGSWHDLGSLAGGMSYLRAIDAAGDVAGDSVDSGTHQPVYVPNTGGTTWGSFVNLFTAGSNSYGAFNSGTARGFAGGNTIVGYEWGTLVGSIPTAYIFGTTAGSGVPLANLVTNLGTWNLEEATAADSSGDIVGVGVNPSGQTDAYLLTPTVTPEPSTLLLVASGLVAGLAYARRKRK